MSFGFDAGQEGGAEGPFISYTAKKNKRSRFVFDPIKDELKTKIPQAKFDYFKACIREGQLEL